MNSRGVIIRPSAHSVKETIDRLQAFFKDHNITIYARINQQAEVTDAGLNLKPLEFILFGNPKAGGPVMAANPLAALDLPLKVIAWEDDDEQVWIAYNDAAYIMERFSLPGSVIAPLNLDPLISKILEN